MNINEIRKASLIFLLSLLFGIITSFNVQANNFEDEIDNIVSEMVEIFEENTQWEVENLFDNITNEVVNTLEIYTRLNAQEPPNMPIEAVLYQVNEKASEFYSKAQTTIRARANVFSNELRILNRNIFEDVQKILKNYGMKPTRNVFIDDIFVILNSFQEGLTSYADALLSTFRIQVRDKLQTYLIAHLGSPTYPEPEIEKKRSFFRKILDNTQDLVNGVISAAKDDKSTIIEKTIKETQEEVQKGIGSFKEELAEMTEPVTRAIANEIKESVIQSTQEARDKLHAKLSSIKNRGNEIKN